MIIAAILSIILLVLGGLHINWALGGQYGLRDALPTKTNGEAVLKPTKIMIFFVAKILISFGLFYAISAKFINLPLEVPDELVSAVAWFLPFIFLLRAIGDFRYVGFFKRVKNTNFAQLDSKMYSPLSLFLAILGLIFSYQYYF